MAHRGANAGALEVAVAEAVRGWGKRVMGCERSNTRAILDRDCRLWIILARPKSQP